MWSNGALARPYSRRLPVVLMPRTNATRRATASASPLVGPSVIVAKKLARPPDGCSDRHPRKVVSSGIFEAAASRAGRLRASTCSDHWAPGNARARQHPLGDLERNTVRAHRSEPTCTPTSSTSDGPCSNGPYSVHSQRVRDGWIPGQWPSLQIHLHNSFNKFSDGPLALRQIYYAEGSVG